VIQPTTSVANPVVQQTPAPPQATSATTTATTTNASANTSTNLASQVAANKTSKEELNKQKKEELERKLEVIQKELSKTTAPSTQKKQTKKGKISNSSRILSLALFNI
jgi:hypothetical protein